jgi:hypothetical protein
LKDQEPNPPSGSSADSKTPENQITAPKRTFVEPEISQPVDVLEATTFFQAVDSGATN